MIRTQCKLVVVIGLVCMTGMVRAQQDPIPPPSDEDEAIATAVQVARVSPQAFSLSRPHNKQFNRVVRALQQGNNDRADRIWSSLIEDIYTKGGPLPNFEAMTYTVVREAILEPQEELAQPADALRFASETQRILREALTLVEARIRETTDANEANKLEMQRQRLEAFMDIVDQDIEQAKDNYAEAREQFKLAMRILAEHMERMTQITQKITS